MQFFSVDNIQHEQYLLDFVKHRNSLNSWNFLNLSNPNTLNPWFHIETEQSCNGRPIFLTFWCKAFCKKKSYIINTSDYLILATGNIQIRYFQFPDIPLTCAIRNRLLIQPCLILNQYIKWKYYFQQYKFSIN